MLVLRNLESYDFGMCFIPVDLDGAHFVTILVKEQSFKCIDREADIFSGSRWS